MPNLVNSVDILAVRHVKQGIEAERFRAVQPLVQVTYLTPTHFLTSTNCNFQDFKCLANLSPQSVKPYKNDPKLSEMQFS